VHGCEARDEAVAALAACPRLGRLADLDLRGNDISSAGARALAASPYLEGLAQLDLTDTPPSGKPGAQRWSAASAPG
jgi:hypothetical protein